MSAKSRNFRRRTDDDDDEDTTTVTPSTTAKPQPKQPAIATNKPKKPPTPTPKTKSLLSFADDDDTSITSSSTRPSKATSATTTSRYTRPPSSSSSHKLSSQKDRTAPSQTTSTFQPQAGTYTKEALLELQKNTRTLAPSKPKPKQPEAEPVIVLKGLLKPEKPTISSDPDAEKANAEVGNDRNGGVLSKEREDNVARLGRIGIGKGGDEEEDGMVPDKRMIEAIRAKRERLRQARAAAPDYIALDSGSNHGEAEGLSDEEPEFRGRIGFLGEKVEGGRRGVFEDFEERPVMRKDVGVIESGDEDEEDEEDKMWEEEQVRKGLGKRLDDGSNRGVSSSGIATSVSAVQGIQQQQAYRSGASAGGLVGASIMNAVGVQVIAGGGGGLSIGGAGGGMDVLSLGQQAEAAKKALHENVRRLKESHGRTLASLARTDENLSSSLMNVTTLENSLAAAGEKFLFMQKLRHFVSVICEFLQDKAPFIEELEDQMQKLHEERAAAILQRRAFDKDDEMTELEAAVNAATSVLNKGGSAAAVIEAAAKAAQAATIAERELKDLPVQLDEFGRDVNLQKRMDLTRRAEARKRRRAKADSKRMLAMKNDSSYQQIEGESSTDESDSESTAYQSNRDQLLQTADQVFSDAAEEYSQLSMVMERFEKWKNDYASSYRDAYMSMSVPAIFSPYVRLELLKWDPLHEDADFIDMKWHSLLFDYGVPEDESKMNPDDADANLIPELVEKLAIPILHHQLAYCWDMFSTRETKYAVSATNLVFRYVPPSSSAIGKLVAVLRDRLADAVANLTVPTWSTIVTRTVPNAARVAAYRFGMSVRLMRNICLWHNILAMPVLEKLALDELLSGKVLPHLRSIQSNIYDAITRTERIVASLYGVWAGLERSVTGDLSPKLQPLVDYLLTVGRMLEKNNLAGGLETETSKLARRLKKMLVELNEYDHARAMSRTFNLKEAL